MDSHLVTIEIGIERGTNQRMQLDRFTFYQDRFKCLNTQTMQCRSTVQHNRMLFDNVFQYIPYFRLYFLDHFLCIFNVMSGSVCNQFFHNERFKQLDCHLFRQTTLINLQFRSNDDYGTSGVVNSFTQQVLTETSGFTFQHIGQRFQSSVTRSGYRTATATVIDQRIYSFLQHTFFISYDNIRGSQLQQSFQTVVTVDDTTVQIIQVRCSKTSTVQLYHRTQIRRNNRYNIHDHPLRSVTGFPECFYNFQTFDDTGTFLSGCIFQSGFQFYGFCFQVYGLQQLFDRFCAHTYTEGVSKLFSCFLVFSLCQHLFQLQIGITRIEDNIIRKIQNSLQCSRRQIQDQTHTGRNSLEVPDMRYRRCQFNMSHTLSTNA
ncbi:predicted protein [Blautia sp. CAG:52]|nr:predicted protein [Blautia sp. CAG:52]